MKQKNLYNVTVVGSFTKDILVWAEDEDAALDLAQSICDNTDLIRFEGDEPLDITAEDVEEIDPFDGFETGNGSDFDNADTAAEDCGECSGDACANCGKRGKPDAPNQAPSSAGKETEALRRLSELLGGPFVGILID